MSDDEVSETIVELLRKRVKPGMVGASLEKAAADTIEQLEGFIERQSERLRESESKLDACQRDLAMAIDAANKGDLARQTAGGMEMEIQELQSRLEAALDERAAQATVIKSYEADNTDLVIEVGELKSRLDNAAQLLGEEQLAREEAERRLEEAERKLKNYEPISLYNGKSIEQYAAELKSTEGRLDSAFAILEEIVENDSEILSVPAAIMERISAELNRRGVVERRCGYSTNYYGQSRARCTLPDGHAGPHEDADAGLGFLTAPE